MANVGGGVALKIKRNLVSGSIPTISQLYIGELAINVADGNLFLKKVAGGNESIQKFIPDSAQSAIYAPIASPTFTGNVTIPAAIIPGKATYNAIPATDYSVSGDVLSLVANSASMIGDVAYINSSGKAAFCKADAIANCPYAFAICADASIAANASGNWLTKGSVRVDDWVWTRGGLIYVSTSGTSGNTLTQAAPTGSGNVIMPVGVAIASNVIYFFGNINSVEQQ